MQILERSQVRLFQPQVVFLILKCFKSSPVTGFAPDASLDSSPLPHISALLSLLTVQVSIQMTVQYSLSSITPSPSPHFTFLRTIITA